jgi:hypothetical protein
MDSALTGGTKDEPSGCCWSELLNVYVPWQGLEALESPGPLSLPAT